VTSQVIDGARPLRDRQRMADTTMTSQLSQAAPRAGLASRLPSLRAALLVDAAVTAVNGAAYLLAAGPLGDLLGLSPALLRGTGAFLLAFAALVGAAARGRRPARGAAVAIVTVNAVWALDSLVAVVAGWGSPSTVGTAWIAAQAIAVGGVGAVQALALRRERAGA
jgi:hypothetical protein